jgi:hypothetical protein
LNAFVAVCDYQVELLRANLLDFHDCLVDEGSDIINAYDNSLIESIIQNCNYLMNTTATFAFFKTQTATKAFNNIRFF